MRKRTKLVRGGATALLAVSLLAGCSAGSSSGDGADGTSLVVGFGIEPANLDFTKTAGTAIPQVLLDNVYETLVTQDDSGEIIPALATDWEVSNDRLTYTFTLRKGVTFSNGDEFDADSAKFSIEQVKSDAWTVPLASGMDVVDHVEAPAPDQLEVVLSRPSNGWLFQMTTRIGAMFSPDGVDDLANKPIGTGPYEVEKFTRGDSLELKRRDDYWGEAPAMTDVTFRYFKDPTAMSNAELTGDIDIIGAVLAPETISQFADDDRFDVVEGPTNAEVVLSFNNAKGPLTDIRVRKAIKYALDRQAIVDTVMSGYGSLIGTMVPPTDPWYQDLTGLYPHDPEKSKQLLKEAGQENLKLRLRLPSSPYAVSAGQVVKSQLAKVGIDAEIDVLEFPARWLDEVLTKHDYDMSIVAHNEPRDISHFGNPDYYFGYDSPKVRELMTKADGGPPDQQVPAMEDAARQLAEDAAADWLFLFPYIAVAHSDLSGVPQSAVEESFDVTGITRS
jgi:peptide/nickel transport system substrate-binding protein